MSKEQEILKTFTEALIELLSHPKLAKFNPTLARILLKLYKSRTSFWNFGLIGLIGMGINQLIIHFLVDYLPLWLANFCAILTAWVWNYHNAIGYLSKYWG